MKNSLLRKNETKTQILPKKKETKIMIKRGEDEKLKTQRKLIKSLIKFKMRKNVVIYHSYDLLN